VRRNGYFTAVASVLLALSIVAFSDNLFTNVGQPSNRDPKFLVHGFFGLAWSVLLVVQANLVRTGRPQAHRRLGIATFLAAAGVVASTAYVFVVVWKGWGAMAPFVRANRLFLPAFAACVVLAWRERARPERHKRYVFVGSFFMMEPVLSRAFDPLVASWADRCFPELLGRYGEAGFSLFFWGAWAGLFVSLGVHDRRTIGRLHPVTLGGYATFVAVHCASRLA
jgi:hypothetical protein